MNDIKFLKKKELCKMKISIFEKCISACIQKQYNIKLSNNTNADVERINESASLDSKCVNECIKQYIEYSKLIKK